jgi:LysM repeat protein
MKRLTLLATATLVVALLMGGGPAAAQGTQGQTLSGMPLTDCRIVPGSSLVGLDTGQLGMEQGFQDPGLASPSGQQTYVIQPGDSLGRIAANHGVSVDELARVNNLSDPNFIIAGQSLIIPSEGMAAQGIIGRGLFSPEINYLLCAVPAGSIAQPGIDDQSDLTAVEPEVDEGITTDDFEAAQPEVDEGLTTDDFEAAQPEVDEGLTTPDFEAAQPEVDTDMTTPDLDATQPEVDSGMTTDDFEVTEPEVETGAAPQAEDIGSDTAPVSIQVSDQALTTDGTVTIERATIEGSGWLDIHADNNGAPGPIIGFSPLRDGVNTDIVVDLDDSRVTDVLHAMLHVDAGQMGVHEFPGPDVPVMLDGRAVVQMFSLTDSGLMTDDTLGQEQGQDTMQEAQPQTDTLDQGTMQEAAPQTDTSGDTGTTY